MIGASLSSAPMTTQPIRLPARAPAATRSLRSMAASSVSGPTPATTRSCWRSCSAAAIELGGWAGGSSIGSAAWPRLPALTPRSCASPASRARSAPRLAAAVEIGSRLARRWPSDPWLIRTPTDVAEPLVDAMGALEREELRVLLLDTKNVVAAQRTVYRGNLAGSSVRIGEVFRDAVRACAAAIIVAHNHPSGDPAPSGEDLRITAELAEAGRLLDIELLDHLIIGRGRWTSLRALGALGQSPATIR